MGASTSNLRKVGSLGEDQAVTWLQEQGVVLVERNWFWRGGELDLILKDGEVLVFAEVKSRRSQRMGTAAEAVTRNKQRSIVRSAKAWLARNGGFERRIRFDVVTVWGDRQPEIKWYKAAFRPES